MVQRSLIVYKHTWMVIFSGFFEPVFYLLGIGLGLGALVPDIDGMDYGAFVTAGAAGIELPERRHYRRDVQHLLQTAFPEDLRRHPGHADGACPDIALGEMLWAVTRSSLYAAAFLVVVAGDRVGSRTAAAAVARGRSLRFRRRCSCRRVFAAMALCMTTVIRTVEDFDPVMGLLVTPMFLFSGIFFPIAQFPEPLRWIVAALPLYHAVELLRALTTGAVGPALIGHIGYLVLAGGIAFTVAMRRLERRLVK